MLKRLWIFSVYLFLIVIAPVLLIMMGLVLTHIPLGYAFLGWLPVAVAGTLAMVYGSMLDNNRQSIEHS